MFHDSRLEKLVKDNEHKLKDNVLMLDNLSRDIRKMEGILYNSAVPNHEFDLPFGQCCFLTWSEGRLRFSSNEMIRPLIETPKEIRLQCKPYLFEFLQECLKALGE